jgi:hypothetical protein
MVEIFELGHSSLRGYGASIYPGGHRRASSTASARSRTTKTHHLAPSGRVNARSSLGPML